MIPNLSNPSSPTLAGTPGTPEMIDGERPPNSGVGLSDPRLGQARRRMLDLINRLHSTGVQSDIDLPMIAVIGSQSVGKSSLIESISGISLPRSSGTCTRCPTECKLTYSTEPWQCKVSLRFDADENGQPLGQSRNVSFGDIIFDKAQVEDRIRRAQRAILNPGTNVRHFLDDEEEVETPQLTFSTNCISLQISGKDVADLSFVDLPGLIASVGQGGNNHDIDLVKELVNKYITKPSCIILLTVTCETDFENQGAHRLTKENDPDGKRTIGVLTKPDRIPPEEESQWLRYIRNEKEPLENGWYCVKLPNSKSLTAGVSWEDARKQEDEFFSYTAPWSSLDYMEQRRLRTRNLTERLSDILSQLISKRLPEIQEELQSLLRKTQEAFLQLPKAPSNDPVSEILHMVGDFMHALSREVEGTPNKDGLLQEIRPAQEQFRRAVRQTAPNFKAYEKDTLVENLAPPFKFGKGSKKVISPPRISSPDFLSNEDSEAPGNDNEHPIYIEEVMERARKAVTRELPNKYPFVVTKLFISECTAKWDEPARNLFDAIQRILVTHVKKVIETRFGQYSQGGLQQRIMVIVADHIKSLCERTKERIDWLLQLEEEPFTLNTHYYADYKDKFLSYYKGCRQKTVEKGSLISSLENYKHSDYDTFMTNVTKILSGLNEIGVEGVKAMDIPKLLPPDPLEPALEIMAETRAYFQVAYKRFTDNVPLAIDRELVTGLERELQAALYKGLGVGSPEGTRICGELVQEPPNILARREELHKKRERLETAKAELLAIY